ncbi:YceI family protein [Arenimonas composti]|uniref:Lipid/polyisoprenoid-binding YceI-like domain-containing protein n=1 Tax=Arenimonas composti TR7-09 = DSM 18010 TaxID=1121013 RepID=A0A091B8C8_9GAMM|nr:YceI family protein [Arenimonas composti]KFN48898.1 hypothetical protein P873_13175 [Arenimonas composti TR7-09 = DSM 18010]
MSLLRNVLALAAAVFVPSADAADWSAGAASTLGFTARYQGEEIHGRFPGFSARIGFDPAAPQDCRFEVDIPLQAVVVDMDDAAGMLQEAEFFATSEHPRARWTATSCRADGAGFIAAGTLMLRGVSKPVPLRFTWTAGAAPVLSGEATVARLQFGVGGGEWADTGLLPDEVRVVTRLTLESE